MDQKSDWSLFHARLHQNLKHNQLLPKQSKILIAVSGGQDSLCLAKLILDLQNKWEWQIAIAHCDHNWSTDAGIAEHVEKIATNWRVPFYLKKANQLKETEAAARKWRYQALVEIAQEQNFDYLVTGHTKSDRAETFLYNLIRGAGSNGLSSLNQKRQLTSQITLIRPILDFTRSETLTFCQQFDLSIWLDQANSNLNYARNRIRQQLIPNLQINFNPQVEKSLVQTSELLRADSEYLKIEAAKILAQVRTKDQRLDRRKLRELHLAIQRRVIRQFLPEIISKSPNFEQIEAVRGLIVAPNRSRTSTLVRDIFAEVDGDWIIFSS